MHDELIRATVSVPAASLLGLVLVGSTRRSRVVAGLIASLLVLLALAGYLYKGETWIIIVTAGLASAAMPAGGPGRAISWWKATMRAVGVTALATALAALLVDWGAAEDAIASVRDTQSAVFVVAGGLAAVFVGGEVIARILHPFANRIEGRANGLENAGMLIGWLERTLLYVLVLAGAPDAAALVIAAKSVARFPSFTEETFAEYYLIGSLLSLLIAAGVAVAVRALLGLTALPGTKG